MFNSKAFLQWLAALGTGAASVLLAFLAEGLGAFDPGTVTSDPLVAILVGAVVAAAAKVVNWLTGKLPNGTQTP